MSRRTQPPPKPVPEEIELDDDDDEEMEEYPDMFEALSSLLATDDGETIATCQLRQAEALEKIAAQFETQNKILVKMLSALSKPVPVEETS
jgi:hypothetical protein